MRRYFRTLRYLRPVQIYGRLWFRLYRPRVDLRPAPSLRLRSGKWIAWSWRSPVLLSSTTFQVLNRTRDVRSATDWDNPVESKLWRYNVHYFDDLNARDAETRAEWHRGLIARWITENPPARGTGWEPYPTSLRITNWIKWILRGFDLGSELQTRKVLDSLASQARWLEKRLEIHLLANHLWANAKALVFAGVFFEGGEGDRWLEKGLSILQREIGEQILGDGGHFERSPMYHSIVLEDVLDMINLGLTFPDRLPASFLKRLRDISGPMLRWLRVMTHPDGRISFFNDSAFGVAPEYVDLAEYARKIGIEAPAEPLTGVVALPESGYVRIENGPATVICDVAPIGPDYLPAHGHADTLAFELSVRGKRVLVNGGTGTYEPGEARSLQRSTRSHNTVMVDGTDSSEVWGAFRVGSRARPFGANWLETREGLVVSASHDGYCRLPGKVIHSREWSLTDHSLSVADRLQGRFESATAHFGLHPDVQATIEGEGAILSFGSAARGPSIEIRAAGAKVAAQSSDWHPEFGLDVERTVLAVAIRGDSVVTTFTW